MRVTWVQPEDLIRHELYQAASEGRDVSGPREQWLTAGGKADPPRNGASTDIATPAQRDLAVRLLDQLDGEASHDTGDEPSDLDAIEALLSPGPRIEVDTAGLPDRVRAAWTGRAVACLLGKPVEKVPRQGIEEILHATGRWPLRDYFTAVGLPDEVSQRWPWNKASRGTSLIENIDGMPEDDDTNYTLMALRLLEQHGADFTSDDVAQAWLLDLPAGRVFTAERAAYRNLLDGLSPPQTARRHNPYREWIGAQIRTDFYGWVNPGDPTTAARWAWRDGCVSHTRNGLYAAMYVSAMSAAAIAGADLAQTLAAGRAVVPPRSRLAAALDFAEELARTHADPDDPRPAYAALESHFAGMHWVHCLNNTALLTYALIAGGGDFDTTIALTVMGGWDTDSNGATAGAIVGALVGTAGIDARWTDPLHDRLATSIPGCDGSSFADLAERTLAVIMSTRPPRER